MFKLAAVSALAVSAATLVAGQSANDTMTAANVTIQFINPVSNTTWGLSEVQTIMWTAPGPQDPQNVSLLLANVYNASALPGYPTPLALNIPSAQQNFTLTNVSIPVGQGYVILMSDIYNSSNIYAQGGFFNVSESSSTSEDSQGTGFSIASYTTIASGAPAGGDAAAATSTGTDLPAATPFTDVAAATTTAAPARRMVRQRK